MVVVVDAVVVVVGLAVVVVVAAAVVVVGRAVVVVAVGDPKALAMAAICASVSTMRFIWLTLPILLLIVDADAPRTCEFASEPWQPEQYCA